jgi:hypothetical protein
MRIVKLTEFAQVLNVVFGTGKFPDITYQDVWDHIRHESIFGFLNERLGIAETLSTLEPADRLELMLEWDRMRRHTDPFHPDGHRNGVCLLVGYLLEGIARRTRDPNYRLTLETCGADVSGGELDC